MQFISLLDYLLLPFFFLLIFVVATNIRNLYYPKGHPWRKYLLQGLVFKLVGAIFIGFVYQYYYGYGDTALYFDQSRVINEALIESPIKGFSLLLHIPSVYDGEYQMYISRIEWYSGLNMYIVIAIAAFFNIFTFTTFLPTSLLFACLCYTGVWAMFRTFAHQYPQHLRQVAVAVLFIPSTFIWGSGIFKDTICLFALGWITHSVFKLLIDRKYDTVNILMLILSFYILAIVKVYILLAFIPAVGLWLVFTYSSKIRNKSVRSLIKFSLLGLIVAAFLVMSSVFERELGTYSLDNIAKTAETTRKYVYDMSESMDGSGYNIGEIDPSAIGLLKVFPKALIISLYGPFLWESRKVIIFINSIEATLFLFISLRVITRVGFRKIWKIIKNDANLQFFLVFVIIFGFAVGLTSGNYGSLSRYRIPFLPFFALLIMICYYKSDSKNKPLFPFLKI